jgi:hypothetical protein
MKTEDLIAELKEFNIIKLSHYSECAFTIRDEE